MPDEKKKDEQPPPPPSPAKEKPAAGRSYMITDNFHGDKKGRKENLEE